MQQNVVPLLISALNCLQENKTTPVHFTIETSLDNVKFSSNIGLFLWSKNLPSRAMFEAKNLCTLSVFPLLISALKCLQLRKLA